MGGNTKFQQGEAAPAPIVRRKPRYRRPPRPRVRKKRAGNRLCTRCGVRRSKHAGERRSVLALRLYMGPRVVETKRACAEFVSYAKHEGMS